MVAHHGDLPVGTSQEPPCPPLPGGAGRDRHSVLAPNACSL